ncbi:Outer membrane protein OmpA [Duganella sp. CF402]|uniref:OmpA family protein n=1 Tax=unclassified Duganella TaxID=2636909 RepID=UPI0008D20EF0|nr:MULTISPECIES: OmpA family protein [unclassified Duganella]RZT11367.1 outer membrane protein OmpA-like peptidoglycan-associated protein [Duganella sp. BK701]SEK67884.1 Outer membrane protein OmpA [Duganella sp. CF402]
MKKFALMPAAFAVSVMLAACSSTPTTTSQLDQARGDFIAAQNNPSVAANAPLEFKAAADALDRANAAAAKKESLNEIDKLAYIAKQKIATAQEAARAKQAEADVANASRQRDEIRLEARTAEAEQARMKAERAKAEADAARAQADAAANSARDEAAKNAALQQQLADLQAKQTERGVIITLSDVLFNVDRAELSAEGLRTAQKVADVLLQEPQSVVLVEGFTDSTGTSQHNLELSQRRAESVRSALIGLGVPSGKIGTRGYGEAYPVASNADAGSRQLNRRVEIVLSQNGAPIANRR